jgi:hypothetical protein
VFVLLLLGVSAEDLEDDSGDERSMRCSENRQLDCAADEILVQVHGAGPS